MSEYVKFLSGSADKYLKTIADSQESFLKYAAAYSEWMSKAPTYPVPSFASEIPTPREISEAGFDFATKVLKQQKQFADKLLATAPAAAAASAAS
jgi:hypothetical protein